jgi:hypothetical protein
MHWFVEIGRGLVGARDEEDEGEGKREEDPESRAEHLELIQDEDGAWPAECTSG